MIIRDTALFFVLFTLSACNDIQQDSVSKTGGADQEQLVSNSQTKGKQPTVFETTDYADHAVFAMLGDYGIDNDSEKNVANLINEIFPTFFGNQDYFVVTVGDNNYATHLDLPVNPKPQDYYAAYNESVCESTKGKGEYYKNFLLNDECPNPDTMPAAPAQYSACTDFSGSPLNIQEVNFYPAPGNEDHGSQFTNNGTDADRLQPYRAYFPWARQGCAMTSCGTSTEDWVRSNYSWATGSGEGGAWSCNDVPQSSYDVKREKVHLFFLDTAWLDNNSCNATDINGKTVTPEMCNSENTYAGLNDHQKQLCSQGYWLEWAALQSNSTVKLAFMHHSPFSAGNHGSCAAVQYNFRKFGIASVYSGHTHSYQRITTSSTSGGDDYNYFVNGSGGYTLDQKVCDTGKSQDVPNNVGPIPFDEFNGSESLYVKEVVGYNKTSPSSATNGYGAMLMGINDADQFESAYYDYRASGKDDVVDFCQLNLNAQSASYDSAPILSAGCKNIVDNSHYMQLCDVNSNACSTFYETGEEHSCGY